MPLTTLAGLEIDLIRKRMRSLRLTVYAGGRVRVAAPLHTPLSTVEQFVAARHAWIQKHQQQFATRPARPSLQYVSGEQHLYLGRPFELWVETVPDRPGVVLDEEAGRLYLRVPAASTAPQRAAVLTAWYRQQLKQLVPALLQRWEPVVGKAAASWGVKQMRTRWGTCNISARRIWLNLELIKHPLPCLEYLVVHELTHLHERLHNARFWGLMDEFMPEWRQHKTELNRHAPTAGQQPGC